MPLGLEKKYQRWRSQDLCKIVECDLERNGGSENARMGYHSKKLIDTGPRNCPGNRSFGQFCQHPPRGAGVGGGDTLGVPQDIGVDGPQESATVHEVEELIAVQQVDPRPLLRLPAAQPELEDSLRFLLDQSLPKELIGDILERAAFPGGLPGRPSP